MLIKNSGANADVQEKYSVIGDAFSACRSKCTKLILDAIAWPGLKILHTNLDCLDLSLKMKDFRHELGSISWNHRSVFVDIEISAIENYPLINSILLRWQSGDCRFKTLRHYTYGKETPNGQPEIRLFLTSMKWFDMRCHSSSRGECLFEFKRPMDSRILSLGYMSLTTDAFLYEYFDFTEF